MTPLHALTFYITHFFYTAGGVYGDSAISTAEGSSHLLPKAATCSRDGGGGATTGGRHDKLNEDLQIEPEQYVFFKLVKKLSDAYLKPRLIMKSSCTNNQADRLLSL